MLLNAVILGAALMILFLIRADRLQRASVLIAWLIPGGGHFYLGEKNRGLFLGALVLITFLAGMVIADFRNISPFERHEIWGVAHLFGGLMSGIAAAATSGLKITTHNDLYQVGCLYSGVGALLNILVAIDAYDLATRKSKEEAARKTEEVQA